MYKYARGLSPVQNSMDWFGPTGKVSKKTGPPFEVDPFSRADRLEFWLNGSRPKFRPVRPGEVVYLKKWTSFFRNFSSWTKPIH